MLLFYFAHRFTTKPECLLYFVGSLFLASVSFFLLSCFSSHCVHNGVFNCEALLHSICTEK